MPQLDLAVLRIRQKQKRPSQLTGPLVGFYSCSSAFQYASLMNLDQLSYRVS